MRQFVIPVLILFASPSWAEPENSGSQCSADNAAKLVSLQGRLVFDPEGRGDWQEAHLEQTFCEGSRIRVEDYSRASLLLPNGITLRLNEGTVLSLNGIAASQPALLDMVKGFVHFISRTPKQLKITTPIANAGPEGTEFALNVDSGQASLWVYEGAVKFFNDQGNVRLTSGQGAQVRAGQAPVNRLDIKPENAVNWALYYPPLLPPAGSESNAEIAKASGEFRHGRNDAALAILDSLPAAMQTAFFLKTRAAILLSIGRVESALADIRRLQDAYPDDGDALALQSVIALAQNRKEEAYTLAQRATAAAPQSSAAYSALSYAEQGRFDLEKALKAADQATKLASKDAMAWARKAELELALGHHEESESSAKQALQLDAGLERTQTVMGFSRLFAMDAQGALDHFKTAAALDSAAPLPRLGLGLAQIRRGELEQGRRELEIAAVLDPNNAILRSYLGKAYYEEKRNELAEDQLQLAKLRDPKDPTPYFYEAIKKQSENSPIDALEELQKAIALNDNRAIYRSRQMLDNDLASRNTSLARIYDDLGFDTRASLEASKSLSTDPSNYSAHRFLSDSYVHLPRREIAQVSELLQSQLLQPLNQNPVQPHLSVKGVSTLSGLNALEPSFKDFSDAFERDKPTLTTTGIVGSNDTYSDEAVLSGIHDNTSYSLGQYYYTTDGFRKNANITHKIYNAFLQTALTPDVNLQFEFRERQTQQGDILMSLQSTPYIPTDKRTLDQTTGRAGLNISLTPQSRILGSFIYSDREENLNRENTSDQIIDQYFNVTKQKGVEAESQFIYDGKNVDTIFGGGAYNVSENTGNVRNTLLLNNFFCGIIFNQPSPCTLFRDASLNNKRNLESYSIYNYTSINLPKNLHWTLGFNYELFKESTDTIKPDFRQRINPKLGLDWSITDWMRLRGAYLKTQKRQLIVDQTIEPTQVAGFNQFYDDFNGSQTELKGIGLDINIGPKIFSGFEFSQRNINRPNYMALEDNYRAYLDLAINSSWTFGIEEHHENYKVQGGYRLETNQIPITLKYFHQSGFFAQFSPSIVWQQKVEEGNPIKTDFPSIGSAIGYRLPHKMGIISLEGQNLSNEKFLYQDTSDRTSDQFNIYHPYYPVRTILFRATLKF